MITFDKEVDKRIIFQNSGKTKDQKTAVVRPALKYNYPLKCKHMKIQLCPCIEIQIHPDTEIYGNSGLLGASPLLQRGGCVLFPAQVTISHSLAFTFVFVFVIKSCVSEHCKPITDSLCSSTNKQIEVLLTLNDICFQREEENSSHRLLASNSIDRLCHSIHSKLGSNRLQDVYIEIYKPTFPQNFYISYFVSSAKRFISNQSMLINSYIQREIHNSLSSLKVIVFRSTCIFGWLQNTL